MLKNEVSQYKKVILFTLLLILNIIIRIPSIPHEKGSDSFWIHSLANSITHFGCANWWLNWLSAFGLYPYSYASAIPFSLSGIAQLTGITGLEMEKTLLIFSILMGLFSIFTAYVFAGVIYNDFLFKYITALFFSISQGVMIFTTWEVSTRGPFIVFLPLFIFLILKRLKLLKSLFLVIFLAIFLAATHHYFYFLIPILAIFIVLKLVSKINLTPEKSYLINKLYVFGLVISFIYPFFTRTLIEAGSRYQWILTVIIINIRFIGPIIIFFLGGLAYLIIKQNKKFEEWYLLVSLVIFIPTIYSQTYGVYIVLLFVIFFASVGFRNLLIVDKRKSYNTKLISIFTILILLAFSTFSGFYNHLRTGDSQDSWYMPEITYCAAEWTNAYIPDTANGFGLYGDTGRLFATSDAHPVIPTSSAELLAYKLINESDIQIDKVNSTSLTYYLEGPYVLKPLTDVSGLVNWLYNLENIDDGRAKGIVSRFNSAYLLDDISAPLPITKSIEAKKNKIFENGRIRVWTI